MIRLVKKFAFLWLIILAGCVPMIHTPGSKMNEPFFNTHFYRTQDGATLPLRQWLPASDPKAVLVALHGFNDYSNFFDWPGAYLKTQGVACFAYDQRGFGAAPKRGLWAGTPAYTDDLRVFVQLLRRHYPHQPIYLLGESMGGAVVIATMRETIPDVEGIILVAPALWARKTMPWYQTSLLWTLAHTVPWLTLTGQSVGVKASDNIEMLRKLGRDPLVIKKTRVEAIYGLADLMDAAYNSADDLQVKSLILYGENDELIPKKPTYDFLQRFLSKPGQNKIIAFYQDGYHMLLRDLKGGISWKDIGAWINVQHSPLPSGADRRADEVLREQLK
jgi:acylglycerol lipase